MNKEAILKTAEEILCLEFIEKFASVSKQYLKQHYKEINKAFIDYINSRTFPQGKSKVPYKNLDIKFKEKVWEQFLVELEKNMQPLESQVQDTINKMKMPAAA